MTSVAVSAELAQRAVTRIFRIPAAVAPIIVMPMFFLIAFGGSYAAVVNLPGFPTDNIYNWMLPYSVLQGSSFAGIGTAYATANDLETGFYDRLLSAPVRRWSLVGGALGAAVIRTTFPFVTVLPLGLLLGARFEYGLVPGAIVLFVASAAMACVSALLALGIVYRLPTVRAAGIAQIAIFVLLFLSIGQVPIAVMDGWLATAARFNPTTNVLRFARMGTVHGFEAEFIVPGLLAMGGLLAVSALWVATGLRRFER